MKKISKIVILPLLTMLITGCGATRELYRSNEYISSDFNENYYTSWNDVDKINPTETIEHNVTPIVQEKYESKIEGLRTWYNDAGNVTGDQYDGEKFLTWTEDDPVESKGIGYGPTKNLTNIDKSFAYGYLSKLYDGRVRCDGLYQKSRVQLNKTGYATYFPKGLASYKYFGFSLRGGTTCERKFETFPTLDIKISFYVHDPITNAYKKHVFKMNDVTVQTNNGGRTSFVFFYFNSVLGDDWQTVLKDTTAMSYEYSLKSCIYSDLTDDMNDKEKHHFAVMLYEVMLPDSTWY